MMGKANVSFGFLCFLLSLVVCTSSRYTTTVVAGDKRIVARIWCIARYGTGPGPLRNATDADLKRAIVYYCTLPGVDCSIIRDGQPCSFAKKSLTTIQTQASVVLNLYYNAYNYCPPAVGVFAFVDPSYYVPDKGYCTFPYK